MVSSRKSIAGSGWVTTVSLTRETARGERARSTRHSSLASPRERAVSAYQGQPTSVQIPAQRDSFRPLKTLRAGPPIGAAFHGRRRPGFVPGDRRFLGVMRDTPREGSLQNLLLVVLEPIP